MKKTKKNKLKYNLKTRKDRKKYIIPNNTPLYIRKVSQLIDNYLNKGSYSPTINNKLVSLKSIERTNQADCNIEKAFQLKEPLQIGVNNKCYYYYKPQAKQLLLHNLSANKHINPDIIIPPIQSHSNCWFNAFFVTFFVSDKGRKFFHFLRQLMIEGSQMDGTAIPEKLMDAFALLNFGIDVCLTGNEFAYKLNTNSIIHLIYKHIPSKYKTKYPSIVDIDEAGNPILYYTSIINYLHNTSIQVLFIRNVNSLWKESVTQGVLQMTHLPHIIIFEIYDEVASEFNKKPTTFSVKEGRYEIDSVVVRDVLKQHFCSLITCEKKEMGYDGASFHRLSPLHWKHKMNSNIDWEFEGTTTYDGIPLKWNFMKSYQLLLYYRVK